MAAAMNCEEANDLLALDAVGALEPSDRDEMERHVATCAACRQLAAQYADVASLLPAALEQVPPPARLRRNLMAQVYAEATAKAPAAVVAAPGRRDPREPGDHRRRCRRRRRGGRRSASGA